MLNTAVCIVHQWNLQTNSNINEDIFFKGKVQTLRKRNEIISMEILLSIYFLHWEKTYYLRDFGISRLTGSQVLLLVLERTGPVGVNFVVGVKWWLGCLETEYVQPSEICMQSGNQKVIFPKAVSPWILLSLDPLDSDETHVTGDIGA